MPRSETEYDRKVLRAIASGERVTQRSLSTELGVALGLTNLLVRRLVGKGYVRVSKMGTRHVRYLMTPAGWEALSAATRQSLENTVHLYTETREQIRGSLSQISSRCRPNGDGQKRVVFYGAGDVAEIAYVSLQTTDLTLVGVVDDMRTGRFFHLTISGADQLSTETLGSASYDHVIVTSLRHVDAILDRLSTFGLPPDRIFTLL
jgi:DNA-binding MarR family transcriptional regulator